MTTRYATNKLFKDAEEYIAHQDKITYDPDYRPNYRPAYGWLKIEKVIFNPIKDGNDLLNIIV